MISFLKQNFFFTNHIIAATLSSQHKIAKLGAIFFKWARTINQSTKEKFQ
jgi:hypothetical protein